MEQNIDILVILAWLEGVFLWQCQWWILSKMWKIFLAIVHSTQAWIKDLRHASLCWSTWQHFAPPTWSIEIYQVYTSMIFCLFFHKCVKYPFKCERKMKYLYCDPSNIPQVHPLQTAIFRQKNMALQNNVSVLTSLSN